MADITLAGEVKDWLTCAAILVGGGWALWRFSHSEWLRRRSEIPSLEGNSNAPDICAFAPDRVAVSLRWSWRNVGNRPVYIDDKYTLVEIYRLAGEIGTFIDPRQHQKKLAPLKVGEHNPLKNFGFYMLEPGTTSSLLTVTILPIGEASIARLSLCADGERHPTGADWIYSWQRWQVFRTDLPVPQNDPKS